MPPHKFLTLQEKVNIIHVQELENLSVRKIANRFNIGKTQAAQIIKNKDCIKSDFQTGVNKKQKRKFLKTVGLEVDKLCYDWFLEAKSQNMLITGPIIKAKAKKVAESVKYCEFKASDGWLHKWCKRRNISFRSTHTKSSKVTELNAGQVNKMTPSTPSGYTTVKYIEEKDNSEEDAKRKRQDLIISFEEALCQIARLKQFAANYTFEAFNKVNDVERVFLKIHLKEKQDISKRQ